MPFFPSTRNDSGWLGLVRLPTQVLEVILGFRMVVPCVLDRNFSWPCLPVNVLVGKGCTIAKSNTRSYLCHFCWNMAACICIGEWSGYANHQFGEFNSAIGVFPASLKPIKCMYQHLGVANLLLSGAPQHQKRGRLNGCVYWDKQRDFEVKYLLVHSSCGLKWGSSFDQVALKQHKK
jgi:hypothetical protein